MSFKSKHSHQGDKSELKQESPPQLCKVDRCFHKYVADRGSTDSCFK